MPVLGGRVLPALMIAAFASQAAAQAKACDLDEGTPSQVTRAVLDLQLAGSAGKPDVAAAKLKEAVKFLNDGDMKRNPVGRASVYGKVMVTWLAQPNMSSGWTTRGGVGFVTDTGSKFDIIGAIDSAFTIVETSNPECASQTAAWRQQKPWVDLVNHAMDLGNNGNDSAVAVAKRSLQLSRTAPYGYLILAQASAKANQPKEAIGYYKQALSVATDTSLADTRRQVLATIGNFAADLVETSSGADKATYMAEAKTAYEALSKDPGTKYADAARTGQARLATLSGDTTAIRASYSDQIANPGAFSYASLMTAAVTAARANQTKDAIKLFEAAYAVNPQHRDVLYNLTRLYIVDSAYRKSLPYARQLVAVDPSNPDNFQLLAIAYAQIKKEYDVKEKALEAKAKELGQRANTSKSAAVQKAAIDSAAKLPPQIKLCGRLGKNERRLGDQVQHHDASGSRGVHRVHAGEAKTSLGGRVTNQTDAAVGDAQDFIRRQERECGVDAGRSGGSIAPKATANFTATGTGAGIVAFKYGPIS